MNINKKYVREIMFRKKQVFIIFISNTNNLETSSADLNTSLLFGSATLERKRDAAKTIRYI